MKGKNSLDLGGLDPNPDPEEGKPTSGEGDLLLRERTPSFGEAGELLVGLPLLAFGVFWTRVLGALLRTPLLLIGGTGLGGPFSPISTSALAARGIISWATKITTRIRKISVERRPILGGLLFTLTWGWT